MKKEEKIENIFKTKNNKNNSNKHNNNISNNSTINIHI